MADQNYMLPSLGHLNCQFMCSFILRPGLLSCNRVDYFQLFPYRRHLVEFQYVIFFIFHYNIRRKFLVEWFNRLPTIYFARIIYPAKWGKTKVINFEWTKVPCQV